MQVRHQYNWEALVHTTQARAGISNFNSISIAIDAQVCPKVKAKFCPNDFIDFTLLLNPQVGDTRVINFLSVQCA